MNDEHDHQARGKLQGKTAVITGGSSGIGLAAARLFLLEGARVVVTGSSDDSAAAAGRALGAGATARAVDAGDAAQTRELFREIEMTHGGVDILFVNAGIVRNGALAEVDEAALDEVMRVNVKGAFLALKYASPLLRAGGAVVINTSVAARLGFPGGGIYAASKAALQSLVRTAAAEMVGRDIRVNGIGPGPTDTPVFDRQGIPPSAVPEVRRRLALMVPQRRLAAPVEIARGVLFLASSDSSFMTGEELAMNGGLSAF